MEQVAYKIPITKPNEELKYMSTGEKDKKGF